MQRASTENRLCAAECKRASHLGRSRHQKQACMRRADRCHSLDRGAGSAARDAGDERPFGRWSSDENIGKMLLEPLHAYHRW